MSALPPYWSVLGVPTTAGSHAPGQEKAPTVWREIGLLDRLAGAGVHVDDSGDLPVTRHRGVDRVDGVRDLDRVLQTVRHTSAAVRGLRDDGRQLLVLGGDCTITLGVVDGCLEHERIGLLYFDGDADLNTPDSTDSGILDSMGMTHLLGGGVPALARCGHRFPLLEPDQVELFGFDPGELDEVQWTTLTQQGLNATVAATVSSDPAAAATVAISRLEARADAIIVHFDVDVIDSGPFPLANFPHYAGITLDEAATALRRLCQSPKVIGLVVTEVNPDHDPDRTMMSQLADVLAGALAGR